MVWKHFFAYEQNVTGKVRQLGIKYNISPPYSVPFLIKVSGAQQAQINSDFIINLSTQEEVFKEKLRPMIG